MPPRPSRDDTGIAQARQPKDGGGLVEPLAERFWETKTLEQLDPAEWEALCDRCGRCCLVKLEDEDTGEIVNTDIGCKLFDAGTCACANYAKRHRKVSDCIQLTPAVVRALRWLPGSCAYRLVAEGRPLNDWHPLVSGSPDTVHEAGISVRDRLSGTEATVKMREYVDHVVDWPELSPSS